MASPVPPSSSSASSMPSQLPPPVNAEFFPVRIRNSIGWEVIDRMPVVDIGNLDVTVGYPQGVVTEGGIKGRNGKGQPFIRFPVYNLQYQLVTEQRKNNPEFGLDFETSLYGFITIVIENASTMLYVDKTVPTAQLELYCDGYLHHNQQTKYDAIKQIFEGTHPELTLGTGPRQVDLQDESKMKMPLGAKKA